MGGFRLGSIYGIEIRIDPSWLVIFILVLWSFSAGAFPRQYPGQSNAVYVLMGSAGTIIFFLSVLLHELAHSIIAIRRGIPVEGITLFIFGGVAQAKSEFENPRDEFIIAAAGPVASFAIAAALYGIAGGSSLLGFGAIAAVASYLAVLNFILAVFNLLPGFPLDGGRLLRATIWRFTGDMTRATKVASRGGRLLGFLFIGLGLVQVFQGMIVGGLWMAFIGWFVRMAADSGYSQHLLRTRLAGRNLEDVLPEDVQAVPGHLSLADVVAAYGFRGRSSVYPVIDDLGKPVGTLTFSQIGRAPADRRAWLRADQSMTPLEERMIIDAGTPVPEVLDRLQTLGARPLMIVRDGVLVGVLTTADVGRWLDRVTALG